MKKIKNKITITIILCITSIFLYSWLYGSSWQVMSPWKKSGSDLETVVSTDEVGIGITPTSKLHTATSNSANNTKFECYDNGTLYSQLFFKVSNSDTIGTLSTTLNTRGLGSITFWGVDAAGDWDEGAYIFPYQDGNAGSHVPTDLEIGTYGDTYTNSWQLHLEHNGRVGITEGDPDAKVHITCTTAPGTAEEGLHIQGDANQISQNKDYLKIKTSADIDLLKVDSIGDLYCYQDANIIGNLAVSGFVGIGVAPISYPLDIFYSASGAMRLASDTHGTNNYIRWDAENSDGDLKTGYLAFYPKTGADQSYFEFQDVDGGSTARFRADHYVGINTTELPARLSAKGDVRFGDLFEGLLDTSSVPGNLSIVMAADSNNTTSGILFKTGISNRMVITGETGYIGMNTIDPNCLLDIEGSFRITGDADFGDDDDISNIIIHDAGTITMYDDSDDMSFIFGPVANGTTTLGATGTFNPTALQESGNAVPNATENLSFFAATTSLQLAGVISDETGTGSLVFGTNPTITTSINLGADDAITYMTIHDAGYIDLYDDSDDTSVRVGPVVNGTTTLGITGSIDVSSTIYGTTFDTDVAAAGSTLVGVTLGTDGTDVQIPFTVDLKGTGTSTYLEIIQDNNAGVLAVGRTTGTESSFVSITDGGADNEPGFLDLFSDDGNGNYFWTSSEHVLRGATSVPADDDAGGYAIIDIDDGTIGASGQAMIASGIDLNEGNLINGGEIHLDSLHSDANTTITSSNSLSITGNVGATTYGSDSSVSDAELLYTNTLSSNAQDQLDARCLESVFGTAIGTGLTLDVATLKTHAALQSIAGLTETNGGMPYGTADNTYAWLGAGAEGTLLMGNGAAAPSWLGAGTSGYFLIAAGAADPVWTSQPTLASLEGLTIAAGTLIYGTGADTLAALTVGATTEILVGGGAAAPIWTTATGTGAPARAGSPTFTTQITSPLIYGSSAENGDLTLEGTSSGTKTTSYVILQPTGGNVGIGTTGPLAPLSIWHTTAGGALGDTAGLSITNNSFNVGDYNGVRFSIQDNHLNNKQGFIGMVVTSLTDYKLADFVIGIKASTVATALTERLRIKPDGKVGIGTTAPASTLEVSEIGIAKTVTTLAELTNTANATDMDGTGVRLLFSNYCYDPVTPAKWDSAELVAYSEGNATSTAATQDGALTFSTSLDGAMTEAMRITSAGNVGIGTTGPIAKFQIVVPYNANVMTFMTQDELGNGIYLAPRSNLNFDYGTNNATNGMINMAGYLNGTTQFRSLIIGNGKNGTIAKFDATNGYVGIGTTDPNYSLNINGKVQINDLTLAGGADDVLSVGGVLTTIASSKRYKKDITPIDNVLSDLLQLTPIEFTWNELTASSGKKDIGLIAEDVVEVLPDMPGLITYEKDESIRGINYSRLTVLLLQGMKEQQEIIDKQQKQLNNQQKQIDKLMDKVNTLEFIHSTGNVGVQDFSPAPQLHIYQGEVK